MRLYTSLRRPAGAPAERPVLVREGFSWWAADPRLVWLLRPGAGWSGAAVLAAALLPASLVPHPRAVGVGRAAWRRALFGQTWRAGSWAGAAGAAGPVAAPEPGRGAAAAADCAGPAPRALQAGLRPPDVGGESRWSTTAAATSPPRPARWPRRRRGRGSPPTSRSPPTRARARAPTASCCRARAPSPTARAGLAAVPGLRDAIEDGVDAGTPFLGICVGMQLMAERGLEHGEHAGLRLDRGRDRAHGARPACACRRWAGTSWTSRPAPTRSLDGLEPGDHGYFVHSYALRGSRSGRRARHHRLWRRGAGPGGARQPRRHPVPRREKPGGRACASSPTSCAGRLMEPRARPQGSPNVGAPATSRLAASVSTLER